MRSIDLNSHSFVRGMCVVVPLLFGLLSLALGLDSNWDLAHYHLYNAFSFLEGKRAIDLAPVGFQSYFNPLLDVPYYLMHQRLPAPAVGFIMGLLHGLNFILLYSIARRALPDLPGEDKRRVPLLLALAGCLTANFLSELGNTMGDNMTALLVLSAMYGLLANWCGLTQWSRTAIIATAGSGLLAGMAAGLKLTNASYALAMCIALFCVPVPWLARLRIATTFGVGVAFGIAITGGFWYREMWIAFGNPLFPQFGNVFKNALARNTSAADASWLPTGWTEALLWPFIISLDARRVGQLPLHQAIWPVLYLLAGCVALRRVIGEKPGKVAGTIDSRAIFIVSTVIAGFVIWECIFSVYRYLVPVELVAPLVVFLLATQILPYQVARCLALIALSITTLIVLLGGVRSWGHERWAAEGYRAELPTMANPAKTTVLIIAGDPPWGWVVTQFPASAAFIGVGIGIFDTPAYVAQTHEIVRQRGGEAFALIEGSSDDVPEKVLAENRAWIEKTAKDYAYFGFAIDATQCSSHAAYMGRKKKTYQWCRLRSQGNPLVSGAPRSAATLSAFVPG